MANIRKIEDILNINFNSLDECAVKALLYGEPERIRAEKNKILTYYNVSSFNEFMVKVENDEIEDTLAHEDIVRLDYLEYYEELLEKSLKEIENKC